MQLQRPLYSLSVPSPLHGFSLEPAAVPLTHERSSGTTSVGWGQPGSSQWGAQPLQSSDSLASSGSRVPAFGTAGYVFRPYLERDDRGDVFAYQHLQCRLDMSHKSPEELRLEDYALNGIAPYEPAKIEPRDTVPPSQTPSLFGSSTFGTSTGGLFGSQFGASQPSSAFAPSTTFQTGGTPSAFAGLASSTSPWGTSTAGFGAPTQSSFGSSLFGAPAQPTSAFGASAFGSSAFSSTPSPFMTTPSPFAQQQSSSFFAPSQTQPNFNSFLSSPSFAAPTFSAFGAPFQTPQHAHFFWSDSPVDVFTSFLSSLPAHLSSVSFGGVTVVVPSQAACEQMRRAEQVRLAKVDQDPYGLSMWAPTTIDADVAATKEAREEEKEDPSVVLGSPLKVGTSSPRLSSTRSPLLLSTPHTPHTPVTPTHSHGRSQTVCASFSSSPRLGPLPASPYRTLDPPAVVHHIASPLLMSRQAAGASHGYPSPIKSSHERTLMHGSPAASILFAPQADLLTSSPTRVLRASIDQRESTLSAKSLPDAPTGNEDNTRSRSRTMA